MLAAESKSELSCVEQWFQQQADSLRLLAPTPSLACVQDALKQHLPSRVARVFPRLQNPESALEWLSLVLKTNFLIQLWRSPNEPVLVAMNVSGGSAKLAENQLALIQSPEFTAARQALGISSHWMLTIAEIKCVPTRDELLDLLYDQLDVKDECAVIQLGEMPEPFSQQ